MIDETYDNDAEGKADELQARELGSALADLNSGIDRRKPSGLKPCIGVMADGTKCGAIDRRIQEGSRFVKTALTHSKRNREVKYES